MSSSREWLVARWMLFAAFIALANLAGISWVAHARSAKGRAEGDGPETAFCRCYQMYDGTAILEIWNDDTGQLLSRTVTQPATISGLCYVWWPAVAGVILTPLAIAASLTRAGRWIVEEMSLPLPRMTTRRWVIVVGVLGTELGLIVSSMRSSGIDPMRIDWSPTLMTLATIHCLAFSPVWIALTYRWWHRRRNGASLVMAPTVDVKAVS